MRILAFDIGDKRIGVAVSDELLLTAQGVEVFLHKTDVATLARIVEFVKEYSASIVVIGLPKNMNGTIGPRGERSQKLAEELAALVPDVEVKLWDERLTTVAAERTLVSADMSRKKRKNVVDKLAAVLILQGFLDSGKFHKIP